MQNIGLHLHDLQKERLNPEFPEPFWHNLPDIKNRFINPFYKGRWW